MIRTVDVGALASEIKRKHDSKRNRKKNISLIYAFNATGKTRLSNKVNELINERELSVDEYINDRVICFNAFTEDLFRWDNENFILELNPNSWIIRLILEQGLENRITESFREFVNIRLEPNFDLNEGKITFDIVSGDENSQLTIKISKGEESIFIWSIFYTILKIAVENLNEIEEDRTTPFFNNLEYIIIDDPVSSIDDTKIISLVVNLVNLINEYRGSKKINVILLTHHALFYNVTYNSFFRKNHCNFFPYILSKKGNDFIFEENQRDIPFAYHLVVKEEIKKAIESNKLKRYHFNLIRALFEKTSNFLGYKCWSNCIEEDKREEFSRLINLYSHGQLVELEYANLSELEKELFTTVFNDFLNKFNWEGNGYE